MKSVNIIFRIAAIASLGVCCILSYVTGNEAERAFNKYQKIEFSMAETPCFQQLDKSLQEDISFLGEDLSVVGLHGYDQFAWNLTLVVIVGLMGVGITIFEIIKFMRSRNSNVL